MIDVVVTTISDGTFLHRWAKLIEEAQRDDVRLVVIPDVNTPDFSDIARRYPFVECPSPDDQELFLRKIGCDDRFIPWRSDNRRNVGFLMSWRDGADVMISVDDDNFPVDAAWFDRHSYVAMPPLEYRIETAEWFNPCVLIDQTGLLYARGFPYFARERGRARGSFSWGIRELAISAGLWLGDPDVDAVTRLSLRPISRADHFTDSLVVDHATWAPVNSQNTAIRREVIPAYWFTRMPTWGGRMGDIFSGYFAQACAKHLGHAVRFGTPLVTQDRNPHDVMADLELEAPFYRLLEEMLAWLPGVTLEGGTYRDAYESLSCALHEFAEMLPSDREQGFMHQTAYRMRYWLHLCDEIGKP